MIPINPINLINPGSDKRPHPDPLQRRGRKEKHPFPLIPSIPLIPVQTISQNSTLPAKDFYLLPESRFYDKQLKKAERYR